jgi:hypothetical protein
MPKKYIKTSNGDVLEADIVGNNTPSAAEIQNIFASLSDGGDTVKLPKSNISVKSIKKIKDVNNLSTFDGLKNNAARGFSFGLSRHAESNKEATDKWNDKHPFMSTIADTVGALPSLAIPGAAVGKLIKVAANIPKLVKVVKAAKVAQKVAKAHKIIGAGVSGGIYSGLRSNVESRDYDPDNVAANTVRAAALGIPISMAFAGLGRGAAKLMNRSGAKANAFIEKLGGQKNFKKIASTNKKLIHSDDPAITDLLKSTKLTAKDKAIIVNKYMKAQGSNPQFVEKALRSLEPGKSQNHTVNFMKAISDKRYGKVDFDSPLKVNSSTTTIKVGPTGKAKVEIGPDTGNRFFAAAAKKAGQRSPSSDLGGKNWLNNEYSTKQLTAVRRELYDMQNQYLAKNRKLDAKEIGEKIGEINDYIARKNKPLAKADKSFSRMKNVEKNYEEGKAFKGYKPGETEPNANASFVRGVWEQVKANRANHGGINDLGDINKIMPQHIQNVFSSSRPKTFSRVQRGLARRAREQANLKTMVSAMPEYSKGFDMHGSEIAKFATRPKRALIGQAVKGANAVSDAYEYNPKEMANLMYRNSKDVYNEVSKAAAPTKKGKVLDTVLQSFAKTGGRGYLNGRRYNGL